MFSRRTQYLLFAEVSAAVLELGTVNVLGFLSMCLTSLDHGRGMSSFRTDEQHKGAKLTICKSTGVLVPVPDQELQLEAQPKPTIEPHGWLDAENLSGAFPSSLSQCDLEEIDLSDFG